MNYLTKEQIFGMYLGQRIIDYTNTDTLIISVKLIGVTLNIVTYINSDGVCFETGLDDCKLILRRFEDMTHEEMIKYNLDFQINAGINPLTKKHGLETINYLISIGIDVFDCHSKGWVVYESELQKGD